jgi:hypothetical protein
MKIRLYVSTSALALAFAFAGNAHAAGYGQSMQRNPAPVMYAHVGTSLQTKLFTSPSVVQVGQLVTISVVAPVPSSVRVSFHSFHHSFSGTALYQSSSRAYVISVRLLVKRTERSKHR